MIRAACITFLLLLHAAPASAQATVPTVGMEGRIEITTAGLPLEARPVDPKSKLVLRIAAAVEADVGTRYDIRYIGFVPGDYDLRDFLVRADGSTAADLPPLPVTIAGVLAPEHNGQLNPADLSPLRRLGGYRVVAALAVVAWLALLVPLVLLRRRSKVIATPIDAARAPTLAELLQPLVIRAADGSLDPSGQAELERLLLVHWSQRLNVEHLPPMEAISRLKADPEAGRLLRALEDWLHRPPDRRGAIDLPQLLAPYR